jgi:hypothetical protein
MSRTFITFAAVACAAAMAAGAAQAATSILVNGDFEGGVQSVTVGSKTNDSVPVGWTANDAFVTEPGFNEVLSGFAHSGNNSLSFGNLDSDPVAVLSQAFDDVAGDLYSVDFWVRIETPGEVTVDPRSFFNLRVGNLASAGLVANFPTDYLELNFQFTGTGHDELSLSAFSDSSLFLVDDITVTDMSPGAPGGVPEPASWAMMILGLGAAGSALRRRRIVPAAA